jgi:hypothetical protein
MMEEGWEIGNESRGWKIVSKDLSTYTKVSNLPPSSISSWDNFERVFIRKFVEQKTTTSFCNEFGTIRMGKREKVKYFNHGFLNVLTNFIVDITPAQSLATKYYTPTIIFYICMFFKRTDKKTLTLNFD